LKKLDVQKLETANKNLEKELPENKKLVE